MDRSTILFGHSMEGLIAYEVASRLATAKPTCHLELWRSAYRAPGLPLRHPPLHQLDDASFLEALGRIGGTPQTILSNPEVAAYYLPLLRADFALHERHTHRPHAPLDCNIVTLAGADDPLVPPEDMFGWAHVTTGSCRHETMTGDHFSLKDGERAFMARLQAHLRRLAVH
jgi:surfactin synthase thioesterase subunit